MTKLTIKLTMSIYIVFEKGAPFLDRFWKILAVTIVSFTDISSQNIICSANNTMSHVSQF